MEKAREERRGLWSQKGLMVLLLVGITVSLLGVLAPQVWATPHQDALLQTIPPVGGETVPANSLALLAPFVGLALVVAGVVAAGIVWKRRHS